MSGTIISLKKFSDGGGGGGVVVCLIIVSLLALVCQKSNVRDPVMPGQVKTRAKELDNKKLMSAIARNRLVLLVTL